MPHLTIKLVPGVDTNKTPTLNEMAVSYTNLVRFMPDRSGYGLVQKLGGWTRYIDSGFGNVIRELKAWSDLEFNKYLAIGGEGDVGAQVYNPGDSSLNDITPRFIEGSSPASTTTQPHQAVIVATTANLTSTYDNGTSGVGATLTNSGAQAALSIDGVSLILGNRVLVKNQNTAAQNGVYYVTNVGSVSTNWELTRVPDFNEWGPNDIEYGASFDVTLGSVNAGLTFVCVNTSTVTVGTTPIDFTTGVAITQLNDHSSVVVATTTGLNTVYANGTSGVGATLTNNGTQERLEIDGVQPALNSRVLVKDQAGSSRNGVYKVTDIGSISTNWELTRVTDFDAWGTNDIEHGAAFYVTSGTVNAGKTFYCTNSSTVTVGSTAIVFNLAYGLVTTAGSNSVSFYTPDIPSSASYIYFPTIINLGNVNLVGPYDILTTGSGFLTFVVPDLLTPIAKISAVTAGSNRTVTIQFSSPHTFYAGQSIYVSGVNTSSFNGTFTIGTGSLDVTTYTITYTQTGVSTAATSYGGTVNANVFLGGIPPQFTISSGETRTVVDLINHGFSVGDTFNAPIETSVGGTTVFGLYTVNKVNTVDQFEINVSIAATSSETAYENYGGIYSYEYVSTVSTTRPANYFYGGGVYDEGVYGSGYVPAYGTGDAITADDWLFDNWGSILVGCPKNGSLYYWQPIGSSIENLSYMPNSPVYNTGAFVSMPQRQIIAYGSSFSTVQDPLLVRWCDLEDFTTWAGTANNQAGSYRIPTGSKIVGGMQAAQQALLWTDLDLWSMTYIGQPYIYGFNKIGANAGLMSQKAAAQMGGVVYWMSQKQFFKLSGNGVEVIPCPIWDQVFQNFYPGVDENGNPYTDRIRAASNSQFNEITWYFPAHYTNNIDPATGLALEEQQIGTGEVNAYVKYNVALNQWDYGYQHPDNPRVLVGRTAWIDQSVLGPPIGAASITSLNTPLTAGEDIAFIYQHETSNDADGNAIESGFTTGYASLADGDMMTFIDQIWPDMKWGFVDEPKTATVKITFYVANYPGETPIEHGPYDVTQGTQYLSVRMRGRLISMSVSSTDLGSFWRIGAIRYRYQPDGKF